MMMNIFLLASLASSSYLLFATGLLSFIKVYYRKAFSLFSLALYGLSTSRRSLLLPWLILNLLLVIILSLGLLTNTLHCSPYWEQLLLLLLIFLSLAGVRQVQAMYLLMGVQGHHMVTHCLTHLVSESYFIPPQVAGQDINTAEDLPPKYEDIAEILHILFVCLLS